MTTVKKISIVLIVLVVLFIGVIASADLSNKYQSVGSTEFNRFSKAATSTGVVIGPTSGLLVATSTDRTYAVFANDGQVPVFCSFNGAAATASSGVRVASGGQYELRDVNNYVGPVFCIAGASSTVTVMTR